MRSSAALRKPLGVRATPEEHRLLTDAAKREHRSLNSFVLQAALKAASGSDRRRTPQEVQAAIDRAQRLMKPYRAKGESSVDRLIAERRADPASE